VEHRTRHSEAKLTRHQQRALSAGGNRRVPCRLLRFSAGRNRSARGRAAVTHRTPVRISALAPMRDAIVRRSASICGGV
jgi:hypothetical protein